MSSIQNIRLHSARLEQLKALAERDGSTITEALERLISKEIEHSSIDKIEGLPLYVANGRVCPEIGNVGTPHLSPKEATAFAITVKKVALGLRGPVALDFKSDDARLSIARRGRGVGFRIEWPDSDLDASETVTVALALDYVRQLLKAAAEASIEAKAA